MVEHLPSLTKEVIYDSGNAKLQWRCNLRPMRRPSFFLTMAAAYLIMAIVMRIPLPYINSLIIILTVVSLVQVALTVHKRTQGERICTTTISEEGLRDLTPDSHKSFSWSHIKRIELVEGDIFFSTQTGSGVFVPGSAFADPQTAVAFYTHAVKLWQTGRTRKGRNLNQPPSSPETTTAPVTPGPKLAKAEPTVEDLLAEDESEWLALEEEHKKRNQTDTGSGGGT